MITQLRQRYMRIQDRPIFIGSVSFLAYRLVITFLMAFLSFYQPPTRVPNWGTIPSDIAEIEQNPFAKFLVSPWYRWDTINYISLSADGYNAENGNTVWPPLFPVLIKAMGLLIHDPNVSVLIVSNLAAWGFFIMLAYYTERFFGKHLVKDTILWVVTFPTAFFLVAGYTESLFLLIVLGFMVFLREKKWLQAGLLGVLAILTRNQGIVLCLPFLVALIQEYREDPASLTVSGFLKRMISLGMIPMAFLIYVFYVKLAIQAPWPWVSLKNDWYIAMSWPWAGLLGNFTFVADFFRTLDFSQIQVDHIADLVLTLLAIALLVKASKSAKPLESSYAWGMMALLLCKTANGITLTSSSRYLLSIYILFITCAQFVKSKWARLALFFFFTVGQAILLTHFEMWGFVA